VDPLLLGILVWALLSILLVVCWSVWIQWLRGYDSTEYHQSNGREERPNETPTDLNESKDQ